MTSSCKTLALIIPVFLKTAEKKILLGLERRYMIFGDTAYFIKSML